MAHFEDLTPYAYILSRWTEQPDAVNVGWLSNKPEPIGPVPVGFSERLATLVNKPVNLCRGSHSCWCGNARGNGEIRVMGRGGEVYAAPVLIAHYVSVHGYQPPPSFVEAVMDLPSEITPESRP